MGVPRETEGSGHLPLGGLSGEVQMAKKPQSRARSRKKESRPGGQRLEPELRSTTENSVPPAAERAQPSFGLPHPPPARHHDEHPPTRETPIYRPFPAPILGEVSPSRALAAFRIGHLGHSMWCWAEVLWDDLVRRTCGYFNHDGALSGISAMADRLLEARRVLYGSIPSETFDQLERAVDRFTEFNSGLIQQFELGTFNPALYLGQAPPWHTMWRELESACARALHADDPLHPLLALGVAFGEFELHHIRFLADPEAIFLPEIQPITLRASLLPDDVLAKSSLLQSLAQLDCECHRLGHPEALMQYYQLNRKTLNLSSEGPQEFMALSELIMAQVREVESDLGQIADDSWAVTVKPQVQDQAAKLLPKPSWDKGQYELRLGDRIIRLVDSKKAKNLIPILDAFQEDAWPNRMDDPLSGDAASQKDRLKEAVKSLNNGLATGTIVFSVVGGEAIRWAHA
jgi:hypothetical protein